MQFSSLKPEHLKRLSDSESVVEFLQRAAQRSGQSEKTVELLLSTSRTFDVFIDRLGVLSHLNDAANQLCWIEYDLVEHVREAMRTVVTNFTTSGG